MATIYQAPEGFLRDLERELDFHQIQIVDQKENLILTEQPAITSAWAAMIWEDVQAISINSINDGVKKLRAIHKDWVLVPGAFHRRASLIAEQLSSPKPMIADFKLPLPYKPFGQFTLWSENLVYATTKTSCSYPKGEVQFLEDKNAPSRAYLKLWEALFRYGSVPRRNEKVVDLGASPGGWTYVLAHLGADVLAIDRSELEPKLMQNSLVTFKKGDAFSFTPEKAGEVDWLFSDVICYPDKLLNFLIPWMKQKKAKHIICTIKFQGDSDPKVIAQFQAQPGGKVIHLHHNKHELTFFWSALA